MRALVIGYGSIGARHARLLEGMGFEVAVVSRHTDAAPSHHRDLDSALKDWRPDYVVIANRTAEHADSLTTLAAHGFEGHVLVEKPLFERHRTLPDAASFQLHVGYQLRFHPALAAFRAALAGTDVFAVHVYVGQHLPDWRPGTDYRKSYSARAGDGGGALRDLSHELDYLNWMLGGWTGLVARGGHVSDLEIDSDDIFALILATRQCPLATITMNYLDRTATRTVIAHTSAGSLRCDLIAGTVESAGGIETFAADPDDLYRAEHRAVLDGDDGTICSAKEGLDVVAMIDAAERSNESGQWITR